MPFVLCPGRREEASASTSIPINDLKSVLSLAREQYLKVIDSTLPSAATCLQDNPGTNKKSGMKKKTKNLNYQQHYHFLPSQFHKLNWNVKWKLQC